MNKYKILVFTTLISLSLTLIIIFSFYLLAINWIINIFPKSKIGLVPEVYPEKEKIYVQEKQVIKTEINDLQSKVIDTIKEVWPSVVNIIITKNLKVFVEDPFEFFGWKVIEKREKVWWGSGIWITSDWYVITNKHVVSDLNADYSVLTRDGDIYKVSKIWFDPILDLAVLKIVDDKWNPPSKFKSAKIRSIKEKVKIGQFVIAIWNALWEYENSATFGIISAKWRVLNDLPPVVKSLYVGLYQTDAAINPWNSGWPLINIAWEVIWVNTAISAIGQWIGFALPISRELVEATLKSIKKFGAIKRPFLGVMYVSLNKSIAKSAWLKYFEWAYITKVIPWSPASKVWLEKWDIILQIDDIEINSDNVLPFVLFTYLPGDVVDMKVYKASTGKIQKIKVRLWDFNF